MRETIETAMPDDKTPAAPPAPEIIYVKERRIACDGGGALGHPKVWYALDDGEAECGYCDRKFIYNPEKAAG